MEQAILIYCIFRILWFKKWIHWFDNKFPNIKIAFFLDYHDVRQSSFTFKFTFTGNLNLFNLLIPQFLKRNTGPQGGLHIYACVCDVTLEVPFLNVIFAICLYCPRKLAYLPLLKQEIKQADAGIGYVTWINKLLY